MVRKLTIAVAVTLIGATPVAADLASEVVSDVTLVPSQLVVAPRGNAIFGPPNVSEFPADRPAELGKMRIVPYPHPVYPFGVPNVGEFEPQP
jgi:hypothetical protein